MSGFKILFVYRTTILFLSGLVSTRNTVDFSAVLPKYCNFLQQTAFLWVKHRNFFMENRNRSGLITFNAGRLPNIVSVMLPASMLSAISHFLFSGSAVCKSAKLYYFSGKFFQRRYRPVQDIFPFQQSDNRPGQEI